MLALFLCNFYCFMTTNIHLIGLSGSLRKESFNTKLLRAAQELLPEGVTMDLVSFENLPVYNGDLDKPAAAERPDEVVKFRELLAKADGFVIATPEYNYSIPGGLKNAIDWASRGQDSPLLNKAVALMGATPGLWGTVRAQNAFHPIFQALNWTNVRKPEVFVANAGDKFNSEGALTDEATRKIVAQQLQALKEIIVRIK
jgi:chromate reductase